MPDLSPIEDGIREVGPTAENAPTDAVLVSWVVVAEYAAPGARPTRWVEYTAPDGQGYATSVGLVRLAEKMLRE